jgi:hypothetical protein
MHTVDRLITFLPEFKSNIRRSHVDNRELAFAAVIALAPDSERTLVVTDGYYPSGPDEWSTEGYDSSEPDYYRVYMLNCSPRVASSDIWPEHVVFELRPKWSQLLKVVQTFLAGGDIAALVAASR